MTVRVATRTPPASQAEVAHDRARLGAKRGEVDDCSRIDGKRTIARQRPG
jgi:hypothetical protein